MNRLLCFTFLFALFLAFPANSEEPQACDNNSYTIRTADMSYYDSMRAGDELVRIAVPEWYVEGTPEVRVIMQASPDLMKSYGEVWRDDQGIFHVVIGRLGLGLAVIEDLAAVILHEFVHIITWDETNAQDWTDNCKLARQELMANKVVIQHYIRLGYTPYIYENSHILYSEAKAMAVLFECPAEVLSGMPGVPMPITSTKDSSFKPH